jgi:CDP-glucose 4,6-dehydratase
MSWDFWRGKKVFFTGNTGFKGSWLSLWLKRLGADVRGYALAPPTNPSLFDRAAVGEVVQTITGDIRDRAHLAAELARFEPEIVLHFAAQTVVFKAYEDPLDTYTTNVIGTATLMECIRRLPGRYTVVNITTDKVYENHHWIWGYRETDQLGGRDPYASSKACAELVTHAFRESFFTPRAPGEEHRIALANARAGNVIGGGDWTPYQLVPDAVQALAKAEPVVLRHPSATRPWQHVLDCLAGYLALAEALHANPRRFASNFNFGPPDVHVQPVSHIVETLASYWGIKNPWTLDPGHHPHEDMALCLNAQKARHELGWGCRLPLDEALAWVASWYRRHNEGTSARLLCEEQIERYMGLPLPP